ncbi:MAG: hypothetical protein RIQ99_1501 [Pseudomonadota bacterium]
MHDQALHRLALFGTAIAAQMMAGSHAFAEASTMPTRHVVIVEKSGEDHAGDGLVTQTVSREGRTFVFKTTKPLTDAEIEARIAEVGQIVPADTAAAAQPDAPPAKRERRVQTIVIHAAGAEKHLALGAGAAMLSGPCEGRVNAVNSEQDHEGKHQRTRMVFCTKGDKAQAVEALRQARERVAADSNLPADAKADVLRQLDAQIAKAP